MLDPRSLRANPRPSAKGATLNSITRLGERRRARSVPIDLAAEATSLFASTRSLKRKRTARNATTEEDISPIPSTDGTIALPTTQPVAGSSKILAAISEEGDASRADVGVQENGLLTPAPSQSQFTSRPMSRRKDKATPSKRSKGKEKARSEEVDGNASGGGAESSHFTPVSGRPIKRRRIDRPGNYTEDANGDSQAPNWLETLLSPQEWTQPDDDMRAEAELETSFHLLDITDMTALPNVPVDPAIHEFANSTANGTVYIPPAVAHLLETMHRALATERRARQRAEALYASEQMRCQKLAEIAVTLRQRNALLEVETHAWAARTALSTSDSSAFAALSLSVDGEVCAVLSEPMDVRSLPLIRPARVGGRTPSFTFVDTRQTGLVGIPGLNERTADPHSGPHGAS